MKNTPLKINNDLTPLSADEFESRLRDIGKERYHDNCKFHHLLHSGKLNKGQVQAWALNRYYYQINISIKDSALMSRIIRMSHSLTGFFTDFTRGHLIIFP